MFGRACDGELGWVGGGGGEWVHTAMLVALAQKRTSLRSRTLLSNRKLRPNSYYSFQYHTIDLSKIPISPENTVLLVAAYCRNIRTGEI